MILKLFRLRCYLPGSSAINLDAPKTGSNKTTIIYVILPQNRRAGGSPIASVQFVRVVKGILVRVVVPMRRWIS